MKIAEQLVSDAGFDPVPVGDLSRAREFDVGTPVYVRGMTAAELRRALGLRTFSPNKQPEKKFRCDLMCGAARDYQTWQSFAVALNSREVT